MSGSTSYTPLLRFTQPGVGSPQVRNAWGGLLNSDMLQIENAITAVATISLAGLATYTVTSAYGATDATNQAGCAAWLFTGTPTAGACVVTIPALTRFVYVKNTCVGTVTLTTGSGTSVTLTTGAGLPANDFPWVQIYCDGTNVIADTYPNRGLAAEYTQGASTTWTVPNGVTIAKFTVQGSGNAGGSGYSNAATPVAGGGGGGGATIQGYFATTPGETFTLATVVQSNGGYNATLASGAGDVNLSAGCGAPGIYGIYGGAGGVGGVVVTTGTTRQFYGFQLPGQQGGLGYYVPYGSSLLAISGQGGAAGLGASGGPSFGGPYTNIVANLTAAAPGTGGGGGVGLAAGQPQGPAFVTVEF